MKETDKKVLTREEADKLIGNHIVIPEGYTEIECSVFSNRDDFAHVEISASVNKIDSCALNCCQVSKISVDARNMHYSSQEGVLFNKDATELIKYPPNKEEDTYIIPAGVTKIGESAFSHCLNLSQIEIPDTVEYIDNGAFKGCKGLVQITLPSSIKEIRYDAFRACRRTTDLTIIEKPVFNNREKILFQPRGRKGLIIRCFKDSVAHKHAQENDVDFELL